jgi:hypothetical protein
MPKFNGAAFYSVTMNLQHIRSTLETHGRDRHERATNGGVIVRFIEDPIVLNKLAKQVRELQSSLLTLGTRQSSKSAHRLLEHVASNKFSLPQLAELLKEIDRRLQDELQDVTLIALTSKEKEFYEPPTALFGSEFEKQFPSAIFDLEEATKCLALGRATAAVFHLMRVMEIGVRALAQSLQIPDPVSPAQRNWGNILNNIKNAIDTKWKSTARSNGDGKLFEEFHSSLDAVRNPWRNATMHVENVYNYDDAEHIFFAVKGFMKKLASRFNENGDPKP